MPEPVNPEIEKLRWDAKMLHGKPAGTVWLADAEAAVLACEKRMGDEQRCPVCAAPEGTWPSQSAQHAVLLEQIKTVRAETAAEIVEMLRAEFQRFSEDSQATDYDLAMRDGWLYAADLIVSRFGGG